MPRRYKRRQPSRPSKTLTEKEVLIKATLHSLYADQHEFWEKRLTQLITKNLQGMGRNEQHPRECALHYAGRAWFRKWMDKEESGDFLHIRCLPENEKEAIEITSELAELENEQYEVARFMTGLLLFPAPVLEIKKALGVELVQEIESSEKVSFDSLHDSAGVMQNQAAALRIFAQDHAYVIQMMTERILTKMILGQSVLQEE